MIPRADWTLVTGPTEEPLTLEEAKKHARSDAIADEDDLFDSWVRASREDAEQYLGRGLFTQTWKLVLDDFFDVIWLPMAAPLQSVSSVQYYAEDGTLTVLATSYYDLDTTSEPGRIVRKPNQVWPPLQSDRLGRVVITYVVGWSAIGSIPQRMKDGIAVLTTARARRLTGEAWANARAAAESCWSDRVFWRPPTRAA